MKLHTGRPQCRLERKSSYLVPHFGDGIAKPTWSETSAEAKRVLFPITLESEPLLGLSLISAQLEELYYLEGNDGTTHRYRSSVPGCFIFRTSTARLFSSRLAQRIRVISS